MKLFAKGKKYRLYNDSMLNMLDDTAVNSIDSIVTDPPYELGFMNKSWDNTGIAFNPETWKKCYEVLKPGGYLLAFGGSRTYHRIACAIEDAGFEIRDCIMYVYGSGFPKSMDIAKAMEAHITYGSSHSTKPRQIEQDGDGEPYQLKGKNNGILGETRIYERKEFSPSSDFAKKWQGCGTALKPGYEPIIVARKPFTGSLVNNILKYGVGGINVDECRIATDELKSKKFTVPDINDAGKNNEKAGSINKVGFNLVGTDKRLEYQCNNIGRFPANVIHDGSDEVLAMFPTGEANGSLTKQYQCDNAIYSAMPPRNEFQSYGDDGSAARYFQKCAYSDKDDEHDFPVTIYSAKASTEDRDEGLEGLAVNDGRNKPIDNAFQRGETIRKNTHPTVKPTELMQYLIRLVTPKGGTILDCFMGSGSTGKAAMFENRERDANYFFIGIDITEEYCKISQARIDYATNQYKYNLHKEFEKTGQMDLFDFEEQEEQT